MGISQDYRDHWDFGGESDCLDDITDACKTFRESLQRKMDGESAEKIRTQLDLARDHFGMACDHLDLAANIAESMGRNRNV